MFLPNEVENYQKIKASDDLKDQIIKNVDKTHKRNRKIATRLAAATACLVFLALGVNMYMLKNHVLSIDGVPVLYNSRTIDEATPFTVANVKQEQHLQICVPLEVRTRQEAVVTVSEGTLTTNEADNVETVRITEPEDILWYIYKEEADYAQCVILTDDKKYVYELIFVEKTNSYNIRQLKHNKND